MPWPDHRGTGPRDEGPRDPGAQKAGSHGSNHVERRSQIPEGAESRDAICSTATSITGEARPRGPSMQLRSQQTSGKQLGAPRSKPLADASRGTWAGLAGRTRKEAEPRQQPPDEDRHEELSLGALRDQPVTGSTAGRAGPVASQEVRTAIRGTGWKPALRNRLATSRGPPVTMRVGTLRQGPYVSRAHFDESLATGSPLSPPTVCGPHTSHGPAFEDHDGLDAALERG